MNLSRTAPLLPWQIIAAVGVLVLVVIVVASRAPVRRRFPRMFPETLALAALAAIHLFFFWQPYRSAALVPAGGGDLASYFFPMHSFAASEIQQGRFPFWNPHQFSGMPHLGNVQSGALYPPNVIAYLIADPFEYATLELLAIGHFFIASYGVYLLGRAYCLNRPAAVLAGSIFAYSGFMVAHLGHYSMISTVAWMPFVYAAAVMSIRRASWGYAAAGVLPLLLAILGGHPPILLLSLVLLLVLLAFELWRATGYVHPREWRLVSLLRLVSRPAAMVLLPFGIALPFLGPVYELSRRSVRTNLDYAGASEFSVEPTALLHMILPTVFGSNPTDYWGSFTSTEIWGYAGVVALLLAGYGIAVQSRKLRLLWLAIGLFGVLYLLGPFTPVHGWFYAFAPGFDQIRAAGRGYFWVDLAVALLAGWGLQSLLRRRSNWSERQANATRWGLIGVVVAFAGLVLFTIPIFMSEVLGSNDPTNRPVITLDNLMLLAIWLLLALGVGVAVFRSAIGDGLIVVAVFAVTLIDLFHATAPFNPTTDAILAGFEHPETVAFLQKRYREDGPFRVEAISPPWQPDTATLEGLDDVGGVFDPMQIASYQSVLSAAQRDRSSEDYRSLNVRYLIGDQDHTPASGTPFDEVFRAPDGLVVWEHLNGKQRAWLEGSDSILRVVTNEPGRVVVELPEDMSGGTIIVSQVNYPGWTASIDGESVDVARYEEVWQAIEAPAGSTTIVLVFHPAHWTWYLIGSGVSIVLWLVMAAYAVAQRAKR